LQTLATLEMLTTATTDWSRRGAMLAAGDGTAVAAAAAARPRAAACCCAPRGATPKTESAGSARALTYSCACVAPSAAPRRAERRRLDAGAASASGSTTVTVSAAAAVRSGAPSNERKKESVPSACALGMPEMPEERLACPALKLLCMLLCAVSTLSLMFLLTTTPSAKRKRPVMTKKQTPRTKFMLCKRLTVLRFFFTLAVRSMAAWSSAADTSPLLSTSNWLKNL